MSDSSVINRLEKLSKKIERLTSEKGSYQSQYELDNCISIIKFVEWASEKVIPGIKSDFENYVLNEHNRTFIKLNAWRDDEFHARYFILEMTNINSSEVVNEIIEAFHKAVSEMTNLFEGDTKNTFNIQLWEID